MVTLDKLKFLNANRGKFQPDCFYRMDVKIALAAGSLLDPDTNRDELPMEYNQLVNRILIRIDVAPTQHWRFRVMQVLETLNGMKMLVVYEEKRWFGLRTVQKIALYKPQYYRFTSKVQAAGMDMLLDSCSM